MKLRILNNTTCVKEGDFLNDSLYLHAKVHALEIILGGNQLNN